MSFAYRPLGHNQIRLLKPCESSFDTVAYRLVHVDIATKIEYSALSYTWGPPGDSHLIQLDGEWFPVRENLYDALQAIENRRRNKATASMVKNHIWADAICINQGKDEEALAERSLQITMMTRIYERASTILVWLGNAPDEMRNRLAFRKMEDFHQRFLDSQTKIRPFRPWWWPNKAILPEDDLYAFLASLSAADKAIFDVEGSETHRAWLGISTVFSSPWWTRTWIFQEATVPEKFTFHKMRGTRVPDIQSKVKFLCGSETTSWPRLQSTIEVAEHILNRPQTDAKFLQRSHIAASVLSGFRMVRLHNFLSSFFEVLQHFRPTQCFDPRDKVYAPLCLAPEDTKLEVKPDYRPVNTVLDVYLDVARYGIKLPGKGFDFLGYASWIPHQRRAFPPDWRLTEIPSWLPNWHEPANYYPIPKVLSIEKDLSGRAFTLYDRRAIKVATSKPQQVRSFNATGDTACSAEIWGPKLHVNGVRCGTIKDTMPSVPKTRATASETTRKWESQIKGQYPTGETFSQALNRTYVMDLKEDWRFRACERGECVDFDLLAKRPEELDRKSLAARGRMSHTYTRATRGRNICLLEDGYVGMVPELAEAEDCVFAFLGGQVLYTLRPWNSSSGHYRYIGETYIHGLMDGEVMRRVEVGTARVESLVLV